MRLINREPGNLAKAALVALPFIAVVIAYAVGSEIRLAENPADKLLPAPSTIADTAERLFTQLKSRQKYGPKTEKGRPRAARILFVQPDVMRPAPVGVPGSAFAAATRAAASECHSNSSSSAMAATGTSSSAPAPDQTGRHSTLRAGSAVFSTTASFQLNSRPRSFFRKPPQRSFLHPSRGLPASHRASCAVGADLLQQALRRCAAKAVTAACSETRVHQPRQGGEG